MNRSEREKQFNETIHSHQNIIHKVCFLFSRNSEDRKDLFQDIVLQAWKSYPTFKGNSSFSTWLYKVSINTAITKTKKPKLLISGTDISEFNELFENEQDMKEDFVILYQAVNRLKKIEKAVILLWLEERSYEDIAEIVGISVKNVSVRLVRIKRKLKELIQTIN
jgi:RNA polymerase sigma-70 factor (ECF subfamily)